MAVRDRRAPGVLPGTQGRHRAAANSRLAARPSLDAEDIARIEDGEREVVELVSVDGLTQTEAARALGLSGPGARMRLTRGRRKVRRLLADTAEEQPAAARPALAHKEVSL